MTLTIDQVEDADLSGKTDFELFIADFDNKFFAPVQRRMMKMNWATITSQEKELLRKIIPDVMGPIEEQMDQMMED